MPSLKQAFNDLISLLCYQIYKLSAYPMHFAKLVNILLCFLLLHLFKAFENWKSLMWPPCIWIVISLFTVSDVNLFLRAVWVLFCDIPSHNQLFAVEEQQLFLANLNKFGNWSLWYSSTIFHKSIMLSLGYFCCRITFLQGCIHPRLQHHQ